MAGTRITTVAAHRYVYARECDGKRRQYGTRWTKLRAFVLERDNHTCVYCQEDRASNPAIILEVDHIDPFALGGEEYAPVNCITSCRRCNRERQYHEKPKEVRDFLLATAARRNRAAGIRDDVLKPRG